MADKNKEKETVRKKKNKNKTNGKTGRRGILILLLLTSLLSLAFYLKRRLGSGVEFKFPKIGGVERITFTK